MLKGRHTCEECGSSDSLGYYDDHYTCYGNCDKTWHYIDGGTNYEKAKSLDFEEIISTIKAIETLPFRGSRIRNIYKTTYEFYGVRSEIDENGEPASRYYPWEADDKVVMYKQKTLEKKFYLKGDTQMMNKPTCKLWGQNKFTAGGKTLVITEGEDDACAIQQAYFEKYKTYRFAVVSLFNSKKLDVIVNNIDFINSFEKVILWADNDENGCGEDTMNKVAKAISPGKAHIVDCKEYKDANDAYRDKGFEYIIGRVWNASPFSPAGFVQGEEIWNRYVERKNIKSSPYPDCFTGINGKLKGRRKGEIVLFVAGTGTGKSTITREVMLDIIKDPDERLGIISLEEDVGETAEKMMGMLLELDLLDEDAEIPIEKVREAYEILFADGNVIILDHQGSVGDSSLIDKMRAMCAMGIYNIILDHITIAVSEGTDGLTGNEAVDKMMSDLLKIVKGWPAWLGIVSHLRKVGSGGQSFEEGKMPTMDDIKGSGSIKQISFDIIASSRNLSAETEKERNTTYIRVLKARRTGRTGDAGQVRYSHDTMRLKEVPYAATDVVDDMFETIDETKGIGL